MFTGGGLTLGPLRKLIITGLDVLYSEVKRGRRSPCPNKLLVFIQILMMRRSTDMLDMDISRHVRG
jgi:hypothetical protein